MHSSQLLLEQHQREQNSVSKVPNTIYGLQHIDIFEVITLVTEPWLLLTYLLQKQFNKRTWQHSF